MKNSRRGQILPGAIAILMILTILIPALVYFTEMEAKWTVKQAANTSAFHLAEAGVEKAYLVMSQSTQTWASIQAGTPMTNFAFDRKFEDVPGGTYTVSITSGPGEQQATVVSVGRDIRNREIRALKVIYSNSPLGSVAIFAGRGAQIGGQVNVEWGAVMSPYTIDAANRNWPQFWSASQITTKDTSPNPPNCDSPNCCQWHSYQANLPSSPALDLDFYRSSAAANTGGGCPAGGTPAGSCYYTGNVTDWNHSTTGTVFVEGSLTVKSPGMFHIGNMVVMGNVNLPNGAWGRGTVSMSIPSDAWKQYCTDAGWAHYRGTYDGGAPAAFPGLEATYAPTGLTYASSKIAVAGMLYVGGNFNNGGGGGGNSDVYGALYTVGSATQTANSSVTFYFNESAADAAQMTTVVLTRTSWQDARNWGWPSGL